MPRLAPTRIGRTGRTRSPLLALLTAAFLSGCAAEPSAPPPDLAAGADGPGDGGSGAGDGDDEDGGVEASPLYPRPGARPPVFAPTPPPRPIVAQGSVVAIWDLGGDAPSKDAVAVRQALAAMGIPSEPVARASQLGANRVIILTGDISDSSATPAVLSKLSAALQSGAAVLAVAPRSQALQAMAGIDGRAPELDRRALLPEPGLSSAVDPLLQDLRALAISNLPLADASARVLSQGYRPAIGGARVLARFDDGSAALLRQGGLFVLGLRTQYYLDLLSGLGLGFNDAYTNSHYLQGDLLPLLLRRLYAAYATTPQLRRLAPDGRQAAVILTHDCDSPVSSELIPGFADLERSHGVRSTFMIATSAYKNGIMGAVYTPALVARVRGLLDEGFDVGNHSFGHFLDFNDFPSRRGGPVPESAADYLPRYSHGVTGGGSSFGEIQISRGLLEDDLGVRVAAFRPGFLVYPPDYYEQLEVGGHLRSSARASGLVRTNFPYQAVRARPGGYDLHRVIEYPLAISDRGLDDTNVAEKVAEWTSVIDRNMITGAPTVLLLHPSGKPGRTAALAAFLDAIQGRGLWVGDLRSFAEFYEAQGF